MQFVQAYFLGMDIPYRVVSCRVADSSPVTERWSWKNQTKETVLTYNSKYEYKLLKWRNEYISPKGENHIGNDDSVHGRSMMVIILIFYKVYDECEPNEIHISRKIYGKHLVANLKIWLHFFSSNYAFILIATNCVKASIVHFIEYMHLKLWKSRQCWENVMRRIKSTQIHSSTCRFYYLFVQIVNWKFTKTVSCMKWILLVFISIQRTQNFLSMP